MRSGNRTFRSRSCRAALCSALAALIAQPACVPMGGSGAGVPAGGGDVVGGSDDPVLNPVRPASVSRARVRNESDADADLDVLFFEGDAVVHRASVRVMRQTVTTVSAVGIVDRIEMSGALLRGRALPPAVFHFGEDFDEARPAEYVVRGSPEPEVPNEPATPVLSVAIDQPAERVELPVGSILDVELRGSSSVGEGRIQLFLQADGETARVPLIQPRELAGLEASELMPVVLERLEPGTYSLVAVLTARGISVEALAAGEVVLVDWGDDAIPVIELLEPARAVTVSREGTDVVVARWLDADEDDDATIELLLEPVAPGIVGLDGFSLSGPLHEDPDGAADSAELTFESVLPGLYEVVAYIDDGELSGTSIAGGRVRVLPDVLNEAPSLTMRAPGSAMNVARGQQVRVAWTDGDSNDDAVVSLWLDPDLGVADLSGNEWLLAGGLSEDDTVNESGVEVPSAARAGLHRVVGVITDGVHTVTVAAAGTLCVECGSPPSAGGGVPPDSGGSDGGDPGGGGDGSGSSGGSGDGGGDPVDEPPVADVPNDLQTDRPAERPADDPPNNVVTDIAPPFEPGRVSLSNEAYGGSSRLELSADQWGVSSNGLLELYITGEFFSARITPRTFDVIIESPEDESGESVVVVSSQPLSFD